MPAHLIMETTGIALPNLPFPPKHPLAEKANSLKSVSEQALTVAYCKTANPPFSSHSRILRKEHSRPIITEKFL
jgi:hypothetical protein